MITLQKGDELFVQNIKVLAGSLRQIFDEEFMNKTIQEGSLLQGATFFEKLQSSFLSHSSTFSLQAAKEKGKTIGRPRKSNVNLHHAFDMYESKDYTLFDNKAATGSGLGLYADLFKRLFE